MKQVIFGAGCFWGVEYAFRKLEGVTETEVGYSGGHKENPTYREVCSGSTGHAEVVRVKYDPDRITFNQLLDTFWEIHDPTSFNRQGLDIGEQYRSAIFYFDEDQKLMAEKSKQKLSSSGEYDSEVVTQIEPAGKFWRAEEYHQKYYDQGGICACGRVDNFEKKQK
ncbi:MAG: peptide-methionine (S)-S-oxide reductase MsrA [candidate division Zixibacteria bacterium]|nr:peptide-methionine (S)-S-oxide reductase MsrA [candidate division Zixibacteria bacterium]